MIIKKRQLLLATLIIALGAAVFINWYYTKPTAKSAGTKPEQTTQQAEQGANLGDARYVLSSDVTLDDASAQAQSSAGRPPTTKPPRHTAISSRIRPLRPNRSRLPNRR